MKISLKTKSQKVGAKLGKKGARGA